MSFLQPAVLLAIPVIALPIIFRLIKEAPRYLKPDAWLGFEVGLGQGEPVVKRLSKSEHFYAVTPHTDPDGTVRALMAQCR